MSSEKDQARMIAERIARRVSDLAPPQPQRFGDTNISAELAAVRASLSELQNRLVQIESKITQPVSESSYTTISTPASPRTHSPWLAGVNESYPSEERFGIEEATVSELVDYFQKEKTCSVEPGGKPCDHCSMCSSRGF